MSEVAKSKTKAQERELMPIFIHSDIDDLGLSVNAFRLYAHLARRAGVTNFAWPSYASMGEHCFRASYPKAKDATLRRKALAAVEELKKVGLVEVEKRTLAKTQGNITNAYRLVPLNRWKKWRNQKQFYGPEDSSGDVTE